MELKEIEAEAREQQDDVADIALEVENHKQHADRLEAAVHALLEAQLAINSEGVRRALDHANEAKFSTRVRLDELREQRADLRERNRELQQKCAFALEKKREALEKLPFLLWGQESTLPPGDPGFDHYKHMNEMLQEAIHRTFRALEDLKEVDKRLEA